MGIRVYCVVDPALRGLGPLGSGFGLGLKFEVLGAFLHPASME